MGALVRGADDRCGCELLRTAHRSVPPKKEARHVAGPTAVSGRAQGGKGAGRRDHSQSKPSPGAPPARPMLYAHAITIGPCASPSLRSFSSPQPEPLRPA